MEGEVAIEGLSEESEGLWEGVQHGGDGREQIRDSPSLSWEIPPLQLNTPDRDRDKHIPLDL